MFVIMTFAALDGPRLVTVIVKFKLLDTGAEPEDVINEIPRSEFGVMVMGTLALLLAVFVSRTLTEPTETMFV